MQSKQLVKRLLVITLLVCCYQQVKAARMIKGSKAKNATTANKLTDPTNEKMREETEIGKYNTTTKTNTTTSKSELETTTLSADFEVDGRHAFVNNQFVAEDEEPLSSTSSLSHNHLQHSSYINTMDYEQEAPIIKETLSNKYEVDQKLASKPLLGYDMGKFVDYEDEEASEDVSENDYTPENCEDTQESLVDNNDKSIQTAYNQEQEMPDDDDDETTYRNKPYDSSYQKIPTNLRGAYDNNNFMQQTQAQHSYDSIESNKKYQPTIPQDQYVISKPLLHLDYSQRNSFIKTKPQGQKPHYNIAKTPQSLLKHQNSPPQPNNTPEYSLYDKLNIANNITQSLISNSFNSSFMPNLLYGNSNAQTLTPFSSSSVHNKKFKTISSSIQYVSTPLGDLIFKYSIGMAKHSKTKAANKSLDQQENSFKLRNININDKTE